MNLPRSIISDSFLKELTGKLSNAVSVDELLTESDLRERLLQDEDDLNQVSDSLDTLLKLVRNAAEATVQTRMVMEDKDKAELYQTITKLKSLLAVKRLVDAGKSIFTFVALQRASQLFANGASVQQDLHRERPSVAEEQVRVREETKGRRSRVLAQRAQAVQGGRCYFCLPSCHVYRPLRRAAAAGGYSAKREPICEHFHFSWKARKRACVSRRKRSTRSTSCYACPFSGNSS